VDALSSGRFRAQSPSTSDIALCPRVTDAVEKGLVIFGEQ
jgi:hypothetical protein